tara:strand:+ start:49 stop:597 length:549 start_codon:yes stop_codon:yes gene_type:complete
MKTPFKLKSGNTSSFKNLGSSPVKQTPGSADLSKLPTKAITDMAKNQRIHTKNLKIVKANKPTSSLNRITKVFKGAANQSAKGGKEIIKTSIKNLVSSGKQVATAIGKVAAHPITKGLGKAAAAVAIPATLYDFYKSGQKHSGGKVNPNQKSIMEEGKKKGSIYDKKTKSKNNKKFNFNKGK